MTSPDLPSRALAVTALAVVAAVGIAPHVVDASNDAIWVRALALVSFVAAISAIWLAIFALRAKTPNLNGVLALVVGPLCTAAVIVAFWVGVTFPQEGKIIAVFPASALRVPSPSQLLAHAYRALAECRAHHAACFSVAHVTRTVSIGDKHPTAPMPLVLLLGISALAIATVYISDKRLRGPSTAP